MSGSAFRGFVDLALDWPGTDSDLNEYLTQVRVVKGISLDLVEPSRRSLLEGSLAFACEQARRGERSARSDETCATGAQLQALADEVAAFLARS